LAELLGGVGSFENVTLTFALLMFGNLTDSVRHHERTIRLYDLRLPVVSVFETAKRFFVQNLRAATFVKLLAILDFNRNLLFSHFFELQGGVEDDVFLFHLIGNYRESPVV